MYERRGFAPVKVGDELDVKIEAVGEKGDGIAKKEGFVLFIPGTNEGDEVRVRVTKVLRKVGFAEVIGKASGPVEAPAAEAEPAPEAAPAEEPEVSETFGEEEEPEEEEKEVEAEEPAEEEVPIPPEEEAPEEEEKKEEVEEEPEEEPAEEEVPEEEPEKE